MFWLQVRVGAAAETAERRKHTANDPKCPSGEARQTFTSSFPSRKARVINNKFGRLNNHPGESHSIAGAILAPVDFD